MIRFFVAFNLIRDNFKKRALVLGFILPAILPGFSQRPMSDKEFVDGLQLTAGFPPKLLSTRTIVFHSVGLTEKEQNLLQGYFQQTGIDAVGYFTIDMLTVGRDITKAFWDFLNKREISNLAFVEKNDGGYRITITSYSGKENIVDPQQPAWSVSNKLLMEALKVLQRSAGIELKKENLLINDYPETNLTINPISGKRNEFYAVDMKVDPVAVPKFGDEMMDKELAQIFEEHFPFVYKLVEPGVPEKELRKQGLLYIFCIVHARGEVVRDLMGYKATKSESAFVSVTYPGGQLQMKTIPANTLIYKVYFKHIDSGNIFLGTKWDADLTWQQALINNIKAMKAELRLN